MRRWSCSMQCFRISCEANAAVNQTLTLPNLIFKLFFFFFNTLHRCCGVWRWYSTAVISFYFFKKMRGYIYSYKDSNVFALGSICGAKVLASVNVWPDIPLITLFELWNKMLKCCKRLLFLLQRAHFFRFMLHNSQVSPLRTEPPVFSIQLRHLVVSSWLIALVSMDWSGS